jgi:choline dehydrogenase-like flavoprotein
MNRRRFLVSAALLAVPGAAATLVGARVLERPSPAVPSPPNEGALLALCRGPGRHAAIGQRYLAVHPEAADRAVLVAELRARLAPAATAGPAPDLASALTARVHMGTTRMSDDPRAGVVDRDDRVHGLDNLYIAGSSVFPTVGFANPTLTIVALAHRLAEHLDGRLSG